MTTAIQQKTKATGFSDERRESLGRHSIHRGSRQMESRFRGNNGLLPSCAASHRAAPALAPSCPALGVVHALTPSSPGKRGSKFRLPTLAENQ